MSNPLGEQSNEISFEDRRQAQQQQQEETEKGALGQQQQLQQRYHHQHQEEEEEEVALEGGDSSAENISSKNLISEERIFGSQFTYRDYLFDGNSNSTISAAELQPGPSSGAANIHTGSLPSEHQHHHQVTSDSGGGVDVGTHMPSALLPDTSTESADPSLLSLSVNTSILDFGLQHQHPEQHQQQQQQILPSFSSQESQHPIGGAVDGSVFILPSANSSSSVGGGGTLVDVSSDSSLPTNEYMLFGSSMLDTTTTTTLSAMQETSGAPTTTTTKVVDYFSTPAPLQSALPQESSNVDSLTQQQLNQQLETQHHVQSQQQQQENAPNFGHFRLNGNGAAQHNTVVHSGEVVQVPNDTNNNPISEELKDNIGGLLLNERPPQNIINSNSSNANSVPTTSCNMDNQVSSGGHSSTVQQYMTSTNAGQMMNTTNSSSVMAGSNGNGGPGQTMMSGQELAAQQQQHNPQLVPSSGSNEGQSNVLEMTLPSNYPCYSDEAQMQQQHAFSGSNIEAAMTNQQQQQQHQQQSGGQVDSQMVSNDPSSLYHSHHLPPLQQQQPQQQPSTPTSGRAQAQHSTAQQHHRPIANQQINLNHGQTMPLQQQQQQQPQQQQPHHSQHHSMVANAPATPSLDQYGQSQLMSTSSSSMDDMSSSSAPLQQQQQQQLSSQSSNTVSVDTMTSTPQSTSVSTSSEIKPDLGSYQSTSAETYMLQSSTDGGPQSAQSYLHHQVPLHHAEGQIPSLPHPPSSSSTSNAPQQQQPLSMSTGHQRTASQHYMSSSTETIHTSTSSSNNGVSSHSNGNVGSSMPTSESGNGNSSSGGGQILSQFEQQSISSSQSGPSSSLGQQQQQQSCFVYVKCEPGVSQPNTVTHYSTEAAKPLPSVEQMQYEVQTQPVQQQSRLLLNDPNALGSGHQQSTGDNSLQQMQQVPSQQQQQQQQQLLKQQQSQAAHDDVLSPSQQARPPPAPLPPSSSGTFPASGTQQQQPPQQQICISLASNVPTVTMAGLPQPTSANQSGLRSVGVITDPNAPTLLPTLQQQQQQSSSQAQVNVSATSFSPLPPKKLRYGGNPVETATAVNTSVSQHNPHSAPTASTLLFASKSSVTASSVLPPPPPPALSSQQPPIVSAVSATAAPPPSSSTSVNPNIVQTMLLSSNLASFNQAQSLQSQQQMQSQQQHQQQQTAAGNLVITSPTSVSNLQNVSIKSFVPSSESAEQTYPKGNILLQQTGQFAPPPSSLSVASGANSSLAVASISGNNVSCYPTSGVSSSIQSGSQYSGRIQQVVSSTASVVSSQGQIFFNAAAAATGNLRLLHDPNMNYSILSLEPATIQQGRSLQAHQQQQQQPAQAVKTVTQKIMLHSVPSSESNESSGTGSPAVTPTAAPAATLISLNPKFALPGGIHQGQMAALAATALPTLNNGPGGGMVPGQHLPTHGIILSSVPLGGGNHIPGSQASRPVANFVPIPVVTSAITQAALAAAGGAGAGGVPRSQHLTISQAALGHFVQQPSVQQFAAVAAASTGHSQPTTAGTIISNLSLPSTSAAPPPLATKSTKAPSKSASKGGSKSANTLSSVSIAGKNIHPPPIISEDPAKPFKCVLCGKNLASKNVYQLHLRSHSGEKPFSCHLCNNRFSQKTSLTRHMRSHTGERPFPCQICNKRFADKERIKIHMRIHTGEKPFSCTICGKKFSQKSTVKRHMSVHTGVKPFKCEICGKGFANRGNLTAHTKTHQSQQANQRGSGNQASTSSSATNNNANSNNNQQQQQQQQQAAASLSRQVPFASPTIASVVSNNGVRVVIKTELDDVPLDSKSNLNIPHNHQFTGATMPSAHSVGQQAQQQQQVVEAARGATGARTFSTDAGRHSTLLFLSLRSPKSSSSPATVTVPSLYLLQITAIRPLFL